MPTPKLTQELLNRLQNSVFKANQSINLASNSNPLCNGFLVKNFYQNNILSKSPIPITNKNLESNRYRTYYSSNFLPIFEQIYYQLGFSNDKITILLHPFVPIAIVDFLLSFGHRLTFFEIDRDTLAYKIGSNKIKADLVVHYGFNQILDTINNDFTDDQRIITVDSSNTINTQYYNYLNKLNNAGYIQMVDNNPIPSLFNQIFGLELSNNQLCIGLVTTSINNILTKNYYLTKKESEINNQNQIKFLQFFTYLLGGTVENKKIIDKIKDKIFTTHITLDIDENIQPVKAKKIFEEIFYELQNEIYPDYWLEIIQILENYPKEYNWLDLDFAVIQNQRSENIQKIINLIKQFDNQSGIIFPDNIQYNDLSLFHFYTNQNSLWYARFNQTGVNLWTLPVLHPQAVLTMSDELNSIINNCLICNV